MHTLMLLADITDPKNMNEVTAGFVAFAFQFIPLFAVVAIPAITGGLVGRLHRFLAGYGSKIGEGVKGNPNDPNSLRNKLRRQSVSALTRRQARIIDAGRDQKGPGGSRVARYKARAARMAWRNVDERMSRLVKEDRERAEAVSATGRDGLRYAGAGWVLPATTKAPDFVRDGAGTTKDYDRYYNSRGQEIGKELYLEGKSTYGNTREAQANSLNYAAKKIQSDQDIANFRHAFSQNAVQSNWNKDEMTDAWATATYEYKPMLGSEWYSKPSPVIGANGKTSGVSFADIGNDAKSYHGFISEQHKTKETFKLSSLRDSEWRAMSHQQTNFQNKISKGEAVTQQEMENYAMTNELLDSQVKEGFASGTMTRDAEGNLQVQGPSAAAQGVLNAMYKNRKYAAYNYRTPGPDSKYSVNERVLYDRAAVDKDRDAWNTTYAGPTGKPTTPFDEYGAIEKHALRPVAPAPTPKGPVVLETYANGALNPPQRIEVTGDELRSSLPK